MNRLFVGILFGISIGLLAVDVHDGDGVNPAYFLALLLALGILFIIELVEPLTAEAP